MSEYVVTKYVSSTGPFPTWKAPGKKMFRVKRITFMTATAGTWSLYMVPRKLEEPRAAGADYGGEQIASHMTTTGFTTFAEHNFDGYKCKYLSIHYTSGGGACWVKVEADLVNATFKDLLWEFIGKSR